MSKEAAARARPQHPSDCSAPAPRGCVNLARPLSESLSPELCVKVHKRRALPSPRDPSPPRLPRGAMPEPVSAGARPAFRRGPADGGAAPAGRAAPRTALPLSPAPVTALPRPRPPPRCLPPSPPPPRLSLPRRRATMAHGGPRVSAAAAPRGDRKSVV